MSKRKRYGKDQSLGIKLRKLRDTEEEQSKPSGQEKERLTNFRTFDESTDKWQNSKEYKGCNFVNVAYK